MSFLSRSTQESGLSRKNEEKRKYAKNNLRLLLTLITAYAGFFLRLLSAFCAGSPDKLAGASCGVLRNNISF